MYKKLIGIVVLLMVFALSSGLVIAQEGKPEGKTKVDGFRGEAISQLKDAAAKYIELAKVTPDEKLGWRPAENIRSNTEIWMHVANSNFLISKSLGAEIPADIPENLEKVTDREKVIDYLQRSFKIAIEQISKLKEEDIDKKADFFGSERTARDIVLAVTVHCHSHLGQSIAYARMNGVKPPWATS